jgi:hypothetical protein
MQLRNWVPTTTTNVLRWALSQWWELGPWLEPVQTNQLGLQVPCL